MTDRETIAQAALMAKELLPRFFAGFDEDNRTRQAPNLPNHLSWTLGHVALYLHHAAGELDGNPRPESDYLTADGKGGSAEKFDSESVSFGSEPVDDPSLYPSLARGIEIYQNACQRLADAVSNASPEALDRQVQWGPGEAPLRLLAMRVVFHVSYHSGQIADLRRALGFARVLG